MIIIRLDRVMADRKMSLLKYGTITFSFDGAVYNLSVFRDQGLPELSGNPGQLFILFTDKTSGNETFQYGRYITVEMPVDGMDTELDFNLSFNPYNAYDPSVASIIAPGINNLPIYLTGGEKKYKDL